MSADWRNSAKFLQRHEAIQAFSQMSGTGSPTTA